MPSLQISGYEKHQIHAHVLSSNYIHLKDIWCTLGLHWVHTYNLHYNKDIKRSILDYLLGGFFPPDSQIACCYGMVILYFRKIIGRRVTIARMMKLQLLASPKLFSDTHESRIPISVGAGAMTIRMTNKICYSGKLILSIKAQLTLQTLEYDTQFETMKY